MTCLRMVWAGGLLLGITVAGIGQTVALSEQEIVDLKKLAEYSKTWNIFLNVWAILGPVIGALGIWILLRNRVQKWAEEEITKKANEKVGVDWMIVKDLVNERAALLKRRSKVFIAILNHSTGERKTLEDVLTSLHYPKPKFFTFKKANDSSVQHFGTDFRKSDFGFLIIDNEDGKMSEPEINGIIEENKEAFGSRIIWFTKTDIQSFSAVTKAGGIGVVKQSSRFQMELDGRLPNS